MLALKQYKTTREHRSHLTNIIGTYGISQKNKKIICKPASIKSLAYSDIYFRQDLPIWHWSAKPFAPL